MEESTKASMLANGVLPNTVYISSCRPFENLSFFLASVSISSSAYLANDRNLSRYSTTVILPCFNSLNSSLILLIKPGGTWVLLNLSLNSSQVINCPPVMARTLFHQALASPARLWVSNSTFSLASTAATSKLFCMICSQSSASKGSSDLQKTGGLVFWKFSILDPWLSWFPC